MVKKIFGSLLINTFSFHFASLIVTSFTVFSDFKTFAFIIIAFTLIHLLIKPIINLVLTPLNFLTLGLVSFVVDILIFYLLTNFVGGLQLGLWSSPRIDFGDILIVSRSFGQLETTIIVASIVSLTRSTLSTIFFE